MGNNMVKEHGLHLMVVSMKGNGRMGNILVKELLPGQMGTNTKGNGRMGKNIVKEHSLTLMEQSM